MILKDVLTRLDEVLPKSLIEEKDNSGLLIGNLTKEINHIRVGLEASNEVVESAIKDQVDLLIVHHPLIFSSLRTITSKNATGRKILSLSENGIALFAAHSNLDRVENGLNQMFGQKMGLKNIDIAKIESDGYVLKGSLPKPLDLKGLVDLVGKKLGMECIRYVGDEEKIVEKVGFCTGSGMSFASNQLFEDVDVYLTGDLKYHDAMWVHEEGYAIVDITHFL